MDIQITLSMNHTLATSHVIGSLLGAILPNRGHVAIFGDLFHHPNQLKGCYY